MEKRDLSAAILAGGLGTRLREALPGLPKVLAPVAGRPFVTHLLDQLVTARFREVVLLTGHLGDMVREELGETYGRLRLVYSREQEPLGTGGALRASFHRMGASTALVLNGDSFVDFDIGSFHRFHVSHGSAVSITLARVTNTSRYGRVRLGTHDQVVAFEEKANSVGAGWVNAGAYLIDRRVIEAIPDERAISLEREVLPEWVERGKVFGQRGIRRFLDIGTPETLAQTADFFLGQGVTRSHAS